MKRNLGRPSLASRAATVLLAAAALLLGFASPRARAAEGAYFPGAPTPVQISRNLSPQQAAQAGILALAPKGGFEGDQVLLELEGRQVSAPITVTLHVELAMEPSRPQAERDAIRDRIPSVEQKTERELNRPHYKTAKGEPINFVLDYKYREPGDPPTPGYDQVTVINPKKDLPEPDPNFRSYANGLGEPNGPATVGGVFGTNSLQPSVLAHESLHLIGLDDRYTDIYVYKGREIPLPEGLDTPGQLAQYLKGLKPPLPPPPAGDLSAKDTPGTGRCDIMGTGARLTCRKISKRDLKWIESQAGTTVLVKPGETLLDKSGLDQNFVVAYPTTVFAPPGGKTVAPGVSVYCIDHAKYIPDGPGFDVGPAVSTLPGFDGVEKLVDLNAQLQSSLAEALPGMQEAIWNQTDDAPLEEFGEASAPVAAAARALLAKAGVAENSRPGGLAHLEDPNAASPATGAVSAGGAVLPPVAAATVSPPPTIRADTAVLVPNRVRPGLNVRSTLVIGVGGQVSAVALRLQRRSGHHWRAVKKLPGRKIEAGTTIVPLKLGGLKAGRYRVEVTLSGPSGDTQKQEAALTVAR